MRSRFTFFFVLPLLYLNPIQCALASERVGRVEFDPAPDPFTNSLIDLRFLNESSAGDGGFIAARDGKFIQSATGRPIRFWGVNGPPGEARDRASIRRVARALAKRGINLVRVHTPMFRDSGEPDPDKIKRAHLIVEEMKAEGIYTLFSIYFPLWLRPAPETPWLEGYDGSAHPFAALFFNPDFQAKYRDWWRALLLTPSDSTGKTILEETAVAGLESSQRRLVLLLDLCRRKDPRTATAYAGKPVRAGHSYSDRSALRFDPEEPGKPRLFVHPAMDVHYDSKPSMISETTWTRPNRYRSEAPLFYAAYGALQDSDAIVHFALDGSQWTVKPGYFMQPRAS